MKKTGLLLLLLTVVSIAVVVLILTKGAPREAPQTSPPRSDSPASRSLGPGAETPTTTTSDTRRIGSENISRASARVETLTGQVDDKRKIVRVRADQLLAIVNGVHITLKDLVPIVKGQNEVEQSMSEDEFRARLERAIERELTFQAARGQGIQLTEAQQQRLGQIRAEYQADLTNPSLQWSTVNEATIEFELRDTTALLLQTSLLSLVGAPSFYVTEEQVQDYYQTHLNQFEPLPSDPAERDAAWQTIERTIRERLASLNQAEYRDWVRKYLDQLKASASITVNQPSS